MGRLFRVKTDDNKLGKIYDYEIYDERKWGLPGVKCPMCGATWSNTGLAYPAIDLSSLSNEKRYRNVWPVSLEELEELRRPIRQLAGDEIYLPPGTGFGPLIGPAKGNFGDFAWVGSWTLLIRKTALQGLKSAGVSMPVGIPTQLRFAKGNQPEFLELQIEPYAMLVFPPSTPQPCPACERLGIRLPEQIIVEKSSIPDVDLFRARNFTTIILAKERFMKATKDLKLTDISFQEVVVQ
jgi:uncharacterized double-CXXCG motif protein